MNFDTVAGDGAMLRVSKSQEYKDNSSLLKAPIRKLSDASTAENSSGGEDQVTNSTNFSDSDEESRKFH